MFCINHNADGKIGTAHNSYKVDYKQIPGSRDYWWRRLRPGGESGVRLRKQNIQISIYTLYILTLETHAHTKSILKPEKTRFHLGMMPKLRAILAKY